MKSRLLNLTLILSLGGCASVGPDYDGAPDMRAVDAGLPTAAGIDNEQPAPADWWQTLDDPVLDDLIEQAIAENTDLRVAGANLRAARSVLAETATDRQPQIDADASIERTRDSTAVQNFTSLEQRTYTASSAALGLNWEIDLFGRVRRAIEAAEADVGAAEALHDDVMRIVIADLASAYIDLRGAQQRLDVIERNIDNQQQTLKLTQTLAREGAASELDVSRARAQLRATEARLPSVQADRTAALNRIARLTGRGPGEIDARVARARPLPGLPAFMPAADAADLIRQRPDIRAAERALASATAQIGVSTADLFPTVSFNAAVGVQAASIGALDSSGADFFNFGPALSWNLFNREAIHARIRQAEAGAEARLAEYEGVVLTALEEVDTALARHLRERQRQARLDESLTDSRRAAELARVRYTEGAESFLTVLDAERTLLSAEDNLTASDIELAQTLVDIYRALGGGWANRDALAQN